MVQNKSKRTRIVDLKMIKLSGVRLVFDKLQEESP